MPFPSVSVLAAVVATASQLSHVYASGRWPQMEEDGNCYPGLQYCSHHLDNKDFPEDTPAYQRQSPTAVWTCEPDENGVPKITYMRECADDEFCMLALRSHPTTFETYNDLHCVSRDDYYGTYTQSASDISKDWNEAWRKV